MSAKSERNFYDNIQLNHEAGREMDKRWIEVELVIGILG